MEAIYFTTMIKETGGKQMVKGILHHPPPTLQMSGSDVKSTYGQQGGGEKLLTHKLSCIYINNPRQITTKRGNNHAKRINFSDEHFVS